METTNSITTLGTVTLTKCHCVAHGCQSEHYNMNRVEDIQGSIQYRCTLVEALQNFIFLLYDGIQLIVLLNINLELRILDEDNFCGGDACKFLLIIPPACCGKCLNAQL
jgi:hypothetical protein